MHTLIPIPIIMLLVVFYSNITFQLLFPSEKDPIEALYEGVEFSLQFGNERGWIPITLAILNGTNETRASAISIGTDDAAGNVLIREYLPELNVTNRGDNTQHSVTICDFEESVDSIQFRWLQTCTFFTNKTVRDAWTLDNVLITYQDGKNRPFVLFDGSKYVRLHEDNKLL